MSIIDLIILFVTAMVIFLVIDLTWLGVIAKDYYRRQLKKYMVESFDWRPALIFYVLFIIGLMFFAIVPAINQESLGFVMSRGAAYGFFTCLLYTSPSPRD